VDVHFVEHPDTLHNAVGARGVGEIGTVGMAAAIANAVFNATGIRVRHIPITVEDLLPD
jgi:xanthine dehydrogenase YagR molybdenum-binding subunit